jgi:hypothetical protein
VLQNVAVSPTGRGCQSLCDPGCAQARCWCWAPSFHPCASFRARAAIAVLLPPLSVTARCRVRMAARPHRQSPFTNLEQNKNLGTMIRFRDSLSFNRRYFSGSEIKCAVHCRNEDREQEYDESDPSRDPAEFANGVKGHWYLPIVSFLTPRQAAALQLLGESKRAQ